MTADDVSHLEARDARERAIEEQAIAEYVDTAPPEFLRCRKYRHAWDPTNRNRADGEYLVEGSGRNRVYVDDLTCMRCRSRRVDRLAPRTFELVGRSYLYVDGFVAEGATVPAAAVRAAEVKVFTARKARATRDRNRALRAA